MNVAVAGFCRHGGVKIGEVIKLAGSPYCRTIGGIEAEKIYTRLASMGHIGAHIQFRKARESGVGGNPRA